MKFRYTFVAALLFALLVSCYQLGYRPAEKVVFTEDFDVSRPSWPRCIAGILPALRGRDALDTPGLPAGWWCEGSRAVRIEDGRLRADANLDGSGEDYGASTVWLNKTFAGDIRVEFDAHILASDGDKNNINLFLLFSDPSGKSLLQTRNDRADGQYSKYHSLSGYVFTFLADGNPDKARFRMRDEPGFNLLQENFAYECRQNKTYHVTVTKKSSRLTYAVDGVVYLDKVDDTANPEHKSGIIGFRTWHTDLWWDNVKVTELHR